MNDPMPTFILIGVAKGGTTAIYNYLGEHPEIFASPIKETNYFAYEGEDTKTWLGRKPNNEFLVKSLAEYKELFSSVTMEKAIGEASPLYLESPNSARRIRDALPSVKILASLRHPVDRAFSDYMMTVRNARATWDIDKEFHEDAHFVQVGFYYDKLKRYFDLFPRDQIKITLFDDLRGNAAGLMRELFEFLCVDPSFVPDLERKHNVGVLPKRRFLHLALTKVSQKPSLMRMIPKPLRKAGKAVQSKNLGAKMDFPPELRTRLLHLYRDDILRTQDLIGRNLSMWLHSD